MFGIYDLHTSMDREGNYLIEVRKAAALCWIQAHCSPEQVDKILNKHSFKYESYKEIVGAGFVINLADLGGEKKLKDLGVETKFLIEF